MRPFMMRELKRDFPFTFFIYSHPPTLKEYKRGKAPLFLLIPLSFEGEGDTGGEVDNTAKISFKKRKQAQHGII
jgi:hypothetical protein